MSKQRVKVRKASGAHAKPPCDSPEIMLAKRLGELIGKHLAAKQTPPLTNEKRPRLTQR